MQTSEQVAGEARMIADNLVHKAVCEWIRDDAPVAVRMTLRPEHLRALVRRIAALRAQPERGAEEKWARSGKSVHHVNNMGVEHEWINPKYGAQMFPQGYDPNLGRSGSTIVHQGHTFTLCPGDTAVMADGTIYGPAKDEGGGR